MSTSTMRTLASFIFGLLIIGCGAEDAGPEQQMSNEASLVSRLSLDDGTVVEFHEPQPGELVVATRASSWERLAAASMRDGVTAAELYRTLSQREPPVELVEVDKRVLQARLETPKIEPTSPGGHVVAEEPTDGIRRKSSALTAQEFQSSFCQTNPVFAFKYCWLLITSGYSAAWQWGSSMHSIVYAAAGNVYQQMDVRTLWWWKSMGWTVLEGQWFHMYSTGGFTERRAQAFGTGATYHHSIFGTI